jgi:hypothetical protein
MTQTFKPGTLLVKDGAAILDRLNLVTVPYVRGWVLVEDLDTPGLERKLDKAGLRFSSLEQALQATVGGVGSQETKDRALKGLLRQLQSKPFNCVEVARVGVRRLLGLPYVTISAHVRHIQETVTRFNVSRGPAQGRQKSNVALPAGPRIHGRNYGFSEETS